jgi:cell division protein FtsQ
MQSPFEVIIQVYEKPEVGYFLNGTDYIYFDRDGLIVEISKKLRANIPKISGVTIAKPVQYEQLPVKAKTSEVADTDEEEGETEVTELTDAQEAANQDLFDTVVEVARVLNKNNLVPKEIRFDDDLAITLYFDNMRVKLGDKDDLEDKVAALNSMYDKVEDMEGILHMESYSSDSTTITFRQGETEMELEEETEEETQTEASMSAEGDGDQTSESTDATSESDEAGSLAGDLEPKGTFSTDAEGNSIYTDPGGNTTTSVDEYQYTDENGDIITDGYGYIDPYTGAYFLNSN